MIEIVNLGLNNLGSLSSALATCTRERVRIIQSPQESASPRLLLLPGTGAFGAAMRVIREQEFEDLIRLEMGSGSSYLAGICLGMQLLAEQSEESIGVEGLGLVKGMVMRLPAKQGHEGRVPHVGWVGLESPQPDNSFALGEENHRDVYFSHSYHLALEEPKADVLWVHRGNKKFVGAFRKDNISGYQFHPEKSSYFGLAILSEMLRWAGIEG